MDDFGGLLDGINIGPVWLILGGFIGGFIVARKFPALLPSFFAPTQSTASLVDQIVEQVVERLKKQ